MAVQTRYTVDAVPTTTYSLAAGVVTVSPLTSMLTITLADWIGFLQDLRGFIRLCELKLGVSPGLATSPFVDRIERTATRVKFRFEMWATVLTDAAWRMAANEVDFEIRPALVVSWAEFARWFEFLRRALFEINRNSV